VDALSIKRNSTIAAMKPRKSFANFKLALRVLAPAKNEYNEYNKFRDSNLKAVEDIFDLFQVDGKVTENDLRDIMAATGARMLQKEIDEYLTTKHGVDRDKDKYVYTMVDVSNLQAKQPYLMKQWQKQRDHMLNAKRNRAPMMTANNLAAAQRASVVSASHGEGRASALARAGLGVASNDGSDDDEEYLQDLGVNAYEQFYQAVVLLIDSYGQPTAFRNQGNQIDLTLMEFITSTVGEDMNYNEIQNVIKLCSHPSKGIMRPSFFIKKYAAFAAELELAHNEEMSEGPLHACSDLEPPIRDRRPSQMTHSSWPHEKNEQGLVDKLNTHAQDVDAERMRKPSQ